ARRERGARRRAGAGRKLRRPGRDAARARPARGARDRPRGDPPGRGADRARRSPATARRQALRPHRRLRAQERALSRVDRGRPEGRMRRTPVLSALTIAVGVALIARTVQLGIGGGLGLLFGGLLVVAGSLRLYLSRR